MQNNTSRKYGKRRIYYLDKQKHMMEVMKKKKRMNEISEAPDPSNIVLQELQNAPLSKISESSDKSPPLQNDAKLDEQPSKGGSSDILDHTQNLREPLKFDDDLPELEIELSHSAEKQTFIGRRIISVSHFYKKLQEISNHGPLGCSISNIDLVGEKQNGLTSKFTFLCKLCKSKFYIENDSCDDHYLPINSCAVAGIVSIGGGHSHLEEYSAALNLPSLTNKKYQSIHDIISKNWEEVAHETMEQAAKKERDLAIAEGRFNKDGIPEIDVCVDGCYSKRSYKKNYSALSGAGAIIGKKTGEILYLGVRNKYCYTCDRAEKKQIAVKEHTCFKNFTGPSTGMESDIIVEGFMQSVVTHNLIYRRLISDGDANTYKKILKAQPYKDQGVTVEKIECRNHLLRNFCNKMQNLQTDTRYLISHRKILTKSRIMGMRSVIKKAILKNKSDECPDIDRLFEDILLSHHHAFGNHTRCKPYFCDKHGEQENVQNDFFSSSLWQRICILTQNIAGHARSLIHDVDSNVVERYHSVIAKYIGGKRVNFSLKQSYETRCHAAASSFNTSKPLSRLYKHILNDSPQGKLKMMEERRLKKKEHNNKYIKKKRRIIFQKQDENYGEHCKKEDMPKEELEKMKTSFMNSLNKTDAERAVVEKKTILQRDSSEWIELRRSLLTASNFGRVIKRKSGTRCANLVKDILYKSNLDHVSSIKHGQLNEKTAILQLAAQECIKIEPCGLFIDADLPYLGATPDGVCGEDTIIEVKCPITANRLGLNEAIEKKKVNFWVKNKEGHLVVNKNHNWYYQVQGQLHITKRENCLFAVWSNEKERLKTEVIKKDDEFWQKQMRTKLQSFYLNCLLPEIVDPRFNRNLPIREPEPGIEKNKKTDSEALFSPNSQIDPKPTCSKYLDFEQI